MAGYDLLFLQMALNKLSETRSPLLDARRLVAQSTGKTELADGDLETRLNTLSNELEECISLAISIIGESSK